MTNKNLEGFHEILERQYRDLIHEAILECETDHKTRLDLGRLNSKLQIIFKAAACDGLPEEIINNLIDEAIPTNEQAKAA